MALLGMCLAGEDDDDYGYANIANIWGRVEGLKICSRHCAHMRRKMSDDGLSLGVDVL